MNLFAGLTSVCTMLAVGLWLPVQAQTTPPKSPPLVRLAPPFTADKLLILASLRRKDFAGLDSEFERYQQAFEKSAVAELDEELAFNSFACDDPSVGDLIEEWIIAKPNSFAAHMAMSSYFSVARLAYAGPSARRSDGVRAIR